MFFVGAETQKEIDQTLDLFELVKDKTGVTWNDEDQLRLLMSFCNSRKDDVVTYLLSEAAEHTQAAVERRMQLDEDLRVVDIRTDAEEG
jgi:hypothetical protein